MKMELFQRAIKEIKKKNKSILVIVDVCHCQYTTHGHCGTIKDGDVDNDSTLKNLGSQGLIFSKSRCRCYCTIRHDGWKS